MEGPMSQTLIIMAVAVLAALGLIALGMRLGAREAAKRIVDGFVRYPALTCNSAQLNEINRVLHRRGTGKEIGDTLARVGLQIGSATRLDAPNPEEVRGTMNRKELSDVAWLANYGLRAWTMPGDNSIRLDGRLPRERAEELANVLDRFEREAADLVFEAEDDRDKRIARGENRMKQLSDFYK